MHRWRKEDQELKVTPVTYGLQGQPSIHNTLLRARQIKTEEERQRLASRQRETEREHGNTEKEQRQSERLVMMLKDSRFKVPKGREKPHQNKARPRQSSTSKRWS